MTQRLLLALASGSFVNPVSYGAQCDLNHVNDAVVGGGALSTLTSASAGFTSADTGKTYTLASATAVTTGTLTYVNSTTVTTSVAAAGAITSGRFIWGTNDATAWQNALNAALPGQNVTVPDPNFRCLISGQLNVPNKVTLGVSGLGPFDPQTNPCSTTWGPTIAFVQDVTTAAITLNYGSGLGDFIFYGANQMRSDATTATAFAPVVKIPGTSASGTAGCHIGRPYFANAYDGIRIHGGRHVIDMVQIGALHRGVIIDESQDTVSIRRIQVHPYWRICEGQTWTPTAASLDAYALNNAWAFEADRADSFMVAELFCLGIYGGFLATDSTDTGLAIRGGYGQIGMADLDNVAEGIALYSTGSPGVIVHGAIIGANGTGVGTAGLSAVHNGSGGTVAPKVVVKSWSHRGTWTTGATLNSAGTQIVPATNPG